MFGTFSVFATQQTPRQRCAAYAESPQPPAWCVGPGWGLSECRGRVWSLRGSGGLAGPGRGVPTVSSSTEVMAT